MLARIAAKIEATVSFKSARPKSRAEAKEGLGGGGLLWPPRIGGCLSRLILQMPVYCTTFAGSVP